MKCLIFDDDMTLSKNEFIIENKKDEEFFDIYLNEKFYEKLFFFINIENFQYIKKNNFDLNVDLLSNIYKESIELNKIVELNNYFITSNLSAEIELDIKIYTIKLIGDYNKKNKLNIKNKYFS
jgi:hypothetical protein